MEMYGKTLLSATKLSCTQAVLMKNGAIPLRIC
jgi:hypothetical protein